MISNYVTYLTLAEVAVLSDTWALWELAKLIWSGKMPQVGLIFLEEGKFFWGYTRTKPTSYHLNMSNMTWNTWGNTFTLLLVGQGPMNLSMNTWAHVELAKQQHNNNIVKIFLLTNAWAQTGAHQANLQSAER